MLSTFFKHIYIWNVVDVRRVKEEGPGAPARKRKVCLRLPKAPGTS